MYNILPLILILISLSVIIIISVRKFSALSNLDVDNMPAEKEAKFKERIISNRIKRNIIKSWSKITRFIIPIISWVGNFFKNRYHRLNELKREYRPEPELLENERESFVEKLLDDVEELCKQENYDEAEKNLIDIIGQDAKNLKAFKKLADIYLEKKNFEEAKQTYEHILKLLEANELIDNEAEKNRQIAQIYFNLAEVSLGQNFFDEAVEYIKQALKIEPNNPRYLDIMLEISIMKKDKVLALDTYNSLEKANPENEKLKNLKEQIDGL